MNRVISSIWGKLEEKTQRAGNGGGDGSGGKGKVVKYKTWCGIVDKKAQALLSLFKLLESADAAEKKEKFTLITTKVTTAINEFITLLQTTTFKNSDSGSHHNNGGGGGGSSASNSGNSSLQDNIRATLLEVWNPLLQSLAKLELADVMAVAAVHKAVLLLMTREEFSCEALLNSITPTTTTPSSSQQGSFSPKEISANKDIIVRYRAMLITTLHAATARLIDKPNPSVFSTSTATNSMNNMLFAAKVLAILYWRLPQQVGQAISKILEIPDMELLAPVLSFPAFPDEHPPPPPHTPPQPFHAGQHNHGPGPHHHVAGLHRTTLSSGSGSNSSSGTASSSSSSSSIDLNTSTSSLGTSNGVSSRNSSNNNNNNSSNNNKGSPLYGWTDLYKEVPPMESYLQKESGPWLAVLAKFDVTYITFFKEWILHVTSHSFSSVIPGKVEWTSITGFPRLLQSLLYQMRTKDQPPPPLTKPYPLLELQYLLLKQTNAELIDAYIKAAFLRTNVFDLLSVLNTLNLTEGWFSELTEHDFLLPKTFDINFFCSGLEILLDTDHHQTLLRVITLIYNFSELFEGQHRAALFDVLLTKQFYQLFMHWDPGVRNAYQQLLIFKMVRIKRSTLYNDGYVVKEMARVGVTSYHSSKESGSESHGSSNNSGPFSSLLSSRSGSGFFSSFSNVLPSIFSMSAASPTDDASPAPTSTPHTPSSTTPTTTTTPNSHGTDSPNGNQGNGVLPSPNNNNNNKDSTTASTNTTANTTTPNTVTSSSSNPYIRMGIERTSSGTSLNGTTKPMGNNDNNNNNNSPSSTSTSTPPNSNCNLDVDEFYDMESGSQGDDVKMRHHSVAVTLGDDASTSIDVQLFLKLNSYLKIIEDQLRKPTMKKVFDARLEAYAPYALAEFNQHLARYHQWELKNEDPPRLLSLPFLRMGEG